MPVVAPIDTWVDFGELVRRDSLTLDDFVVLGDATLNLLVARPELAGLAWPDSPATRSEREEYAAIVMEEIAATLHERVRPRGKRHLEAALPLIRFGVKSPMETRARLLFHWAGFPEPRVNADVINSRGEWLGEGDLVWPGVVVEYQGEHHADRRRRSNDAARREGMGDDDVRVFEAFAEDVFQAPRREALVRRVARALGITPTPREHPFAV